MDLQIPIDNFMSDDLKAAINYLNQNSATISSDIESTNALEKMQNENTNVADEIGGKNVDLTGLDFGQTTQE